MAMEEEGPRDAFAKVMQSTQVTYKLGLDLPQWFSTKYEELIKDGIILRDKHDDSRTWSMNVLLGSGIARMSSNWRAYATENELELGDIIIFRVIEGNVLSAAIYHATTGLEKRCSAEPRICSRKRQRPVEMKSKSKKANDDDDDDDDDTSMKKGTKFPLEVKNTRKQYVNSPYNRALPPENTKLQLVDGSSRKWAVSWLPRANMIIGGWTAFTKDHDVKPGDTVFLTARGKNTFYVTVASDNTSATSSSF